MEQLYEMWLKSQKPEKGEDPAAQASKENGKQIHMPTDYAEVTVRHKGSSRSPGHLLEPLSLGQLIKGTLTVLVNWSHRAKRNKLILPERPTLGSGCNQQSAEWRQHDGQDFSYGCQAPTNAGVRQPAHTHAAATPLELLSLVLVLRQSASSPLSVPPCLAWLV